MNPVESEIPVVECADLSFRYGKEWVLEGVTFFCAGWGITPVIGPNGGGKSTLMRLILGLEEPEWGTLKSLVNRRRKRVSKMGYVPQAMRFDSAVSYHGDRYRFDGETGSFGKQQKTHSRERRMDDTPPGSLEKSHWLRNVF